jgi:hypothetical protein
MKLSKEECSFAEQAAFDFSRALDAAHAHLTSPVLVHDGAGDSENVIWALDAMAKDPSIPLPADAYVEYASSCRFDWSNRAGEYDKMATAAIKEINTRPAVQEAYTKHGLPSVTGPASYIILNKMFGKPK